MVTKIMQMQDLHPAEYNPRKRLRPGDAEYEKIKNSILKFGYVDPIICNEDGTIIGGHQRYFVLTDLGYTEVECVIVNLDKNDEKALNIALNKITGEWDDDALKNLFAELQLENYDMSYTGFSDDEINDIFAGILEEDIPVVEDEPPEVRPETDVKLGDIYQLGEHRLMVGDSTKPEDVKALMGGEEADLLITDPPYNVDYTGKTKDALKIENDKMEDSAFRRFLIDAFTAADSVMKPGAVFYIWHADSEGYNFRGACFDIEWKVRQCLIWVKNCMVLGRQDYQWRHEPCLYGWKEGAGHNWYSDRCQTTVLEFDKPNRSDLHPTMKPVGLFDYQIKNSSKKGDNVLDLFGGSGTTIVACEQNGRCAFCMEYDPQYADVIIRRWETLTGKKAVKLN